MSVSMSVKIGPLLETAITKLEAAAPGGEMFAAAALGSEEEEGLLPIMVQLPNERPYDLTVGAITKQTFLPASFSSRGPSADGRSKPDVCAPGVNITSTIPVPRLATEFSFPHLHEPLSLASRAGRRWRRRSLPVSWHCSCSVKSTLGSNGRQPRFAESL